MNIRSWWREVIIIYHLDSMTTWQLVQVLHRVINENWSASSQQTTRFPIPNMGLFWVSPTVMIPEQHISDVVGDMLSTVRRSGKLGTINEWWQVIGANLCPALHTVSLPDSRSVRWQSHFWYHDVVGVLFTKGNYLQKSERIIIRSLIPMLKWALKFLYRFAHIVRWEISL